MVSNPKPFDIFQGCAHLVHNLRLLVRIYPQGVYWQADRYCIAALH